MSAGRPRCELRCVARFRNLLLTHGEAPACLRERLLRKRNSGVLGRFLLILVARPETGYRVEQADRKLRIAGLAGGSPRRVMIRDFRQGE
jgi:hypothetical protein